MQADCLFPETALIDSELTLTVPNDQTAFGVWDLITHVTEGCLNGVDGTPLQDRFTEGAILTAIHWGPKAVTDGNDLGARTQVQWASVVALNGRVQAGGNMLHRCPWAATIDFALLRIRFPLGETIRARG